MSLGRFFTTMLRIGATGFGGPMALVSMLQQHLVERRQAVSDQEFSEGVAIGQVLPGPIAVDAAIHVGYRLHRWLGAAAGAVGLVLPPFLIMLVLTPLYFHYGKVPEAQGFFAGVRPAVVAAIAAAALRMGKRGLKSGHSYGIAIVVFLWMVVREVLKEHFGAIEGFDATLGGRLLDWSGSIFLIVLSGGLGMVLFREEQEPGKGGEA